MMQIVIDIPEDVYTRLFDGGIQDNEIAVDDVCEMARSLRLGTPLPQGHGRLIDADALAEKLKQVSKRNKYNELYLNSLLSVADVFDAVICDLDGTASYGYEDAPTIIPADKKSEE